MPKKHADAIVFLSRQGAEKHIERGFWGLLPTVKKSGKFIVVDQSLKDYHGHHFEYSFSLAMAAKKAGWNAKIFANKALKITDTLGVEVKPFFRFSWTGGAAIFGLVRVGDLFKLVVKMLRTGKLLSRGAAVSAGHVVVTVSPNSYSPILSIRNLIRKVKSLSVLKFFWHIGRLPILFALDVVERVFGYLLGIAKRLVKAIVRQNFGAMVERIIEEESISPSDVVFIHTVSNLEFFELVDHFSARASKSKGLKVHLVHRRDPDEISSDSKEKRLLVQGLKMLEACAEQWLVIHTDTKQLKKAYERLGFKAVNLIPIPFRHEVIDRMLAIREAKANKIRISYLGDARPEKGYQFISKAVYAVWCDPDLRSRVEFVLQSNFNLPGGRPEAGMAEAKAEFLRYPSDFCRLIETPLDPEQYYKNLAESDVVLIPYLSDRYEKRSSGIFTEAISGAKIPIVPKGTWMASELPPDCGEAFANPEDLGRTLIEVINHIDEYQEPLKKFCGEWRAFHNPDSLVQSISEAHSRRLPREPNQRRCVMYMAEVRWLLESTGAGYVFRNQLRFLKEQGFAVYGVFILEDYGGNPEKVDRIFKLGRDHLATLGLDLFWVLRPGLSFKSFFVHFRQTLSVLFKIHNLENDFNKKQGLVIPSDLRKFIKTVGTFDHLFVNYVSTNELVRRLGIKAKHKVLETHDVQSFQYSIHANRIATEAEIDKEFISCDEYDDVIFLNELESHKGSEKLKKAKAHFVSVPAETRTLTTEVRTVWNMLLENSGPLENSYFVGLKVKAAIEQQMNADRRENLSRQPDLLFVSSNHSPNVNSFMWFYNEVYLKQFAKSDVLVLVVGNIANSLIHRVFHPNIVFLGPTPDLSLKYASARAVIVPIVQGEGAAIKTVEAFSFSRAVVGTRKAFRGIPGTSKYPFFEGAEEFALGIDRILNDEEYRKSLERMGSHITSTFCSTQTYDETMSEIFRSKVTGAPAKRAPENDHLFFDIHPEPETSVNQWN